MYLYLSTFSNKEVTRLMVAIFRRIIEWHTVYYIFTFQDFYSWIVTIEYIASNDLTYIQSDENISDVLSPTNSSNSILSTPLIQPSIAFDFTTPVCRLYKPIARKWKFQGNSHTSKIVLKNTLEKEDCLEFVPAVPISNRVDTVAGRDLVYQEEEKRK